MKKIFLAFILLALPLTAFAADKLETAYERVTRTNTLRCGYISWPPYVEKDIKTGKMSGMNVDFVEAIGKDLNINIEWTEEVIPGQQVEALKANKVDAMCGAEGPMYPNTVKFVQYSTPFVYLPFFFYVRIDDNRFDKDWRTINTPGVRIAIIDGDISGFIATAHFPNAKRTNMPPLGAAGQMMIDVANNKADVVINDALSMTEYFKNNPGKLKQVKMDEPVAVLSNTFSVLRGSQGNDLVNLLNQSIEMMRGYGKDKKILAPYMADVPGGLYLVEHPWRVTQQ